MLPSLTVSGGQDILDFVYEALPDPSKYLRLVEVTPAENGGSRQDKTICCKMTHIPVSEDPVYQALSYTWGSDTASHHIELNRSRFKVTENLYWFLYYHSRTKDARSRTLLWIDAICIDQKNIAEKGHQVQRMGDTYQNAQSVIAWLGLPRSRDMEKALAFLELAERKFGDASVDQEYQQQFDDDGTRLINALESIFQFQYWYRTWIVQEVVLAKRIMVRCGHQQIAWDSLDFWTRNTTSIFTAMGRPPRDPHLPVRRLRAEDLLYMKRVRERNQVAPFPGLNFFLTHNLDTSCKNPRDRVYAFLGVIPPPKRVEMIRVDYRKTVEDVFFDVVKFVHDERQQGLDVKVLIYALGLPWGLELNYRHPGQKEMALFDSEQTFLLVANRLGVVTKVFGPSEPFLFSSSQRGVFGYSCFGAADAPTYKQCGLHYEGLAHSNIRLGDILYKFDETRTGFIARTSESTEDASKGFEFISKATFYIRSYLPDEMTPSGGDIELVDGLWSFDKYQMRCEEIDSFGQPQIWFDVGRREIVQVLFEETKRGYY